MTTIPLTDQLAAAPKFWSDDFDMDLLKVSPGLAPMLATVTRHLYVHGGESFGRLNHPSVYNSGAGLVAFFSFTPACVHHPDSYYTSEPIQECTWTEAVRDSWPHTYLLTVDGHPVFDAQALRREFEILMYSLRGWSSEAEGRIRAARSKVEAQVGIATRQTLKLMGKYR